MCAVDYTMENWKPILDAASDEEVLALAEGQTKTARQMEEEERFEEMREYLRRARWIIDYRFNLTRPDGCA